MQKKNSKGRWNDCSINFLSERDEISLKKSKYDFYSCDPKLEEMALRYHHYDQENLESPNLPNIFSHTFT